MVNRDHIGIPTAGVRLDCVFWSRCRIGAYSDDGEYRLRFNVTGLERPA